MERHLPLYGPRGGRWASHRRVINGILFRERTGIPWRDLPERFGRWKTVYERHRRWSADGTWDRILQAVQADADAEGQIDWSMVGVDSTSCRAHQHGAEARRKTPRIPKKRATPRQHRPNEGLGRSWGGLTSKIHLACEGGRRPLALLVTPGQWGDAPQMIPVLERVRVARKGEGRPRTRPGHLSADKAYSSRKEPPLPAQTPHQAHRSRAEGPESQPSAPREPRRPACRVRQGEEQAPHRSRADDQPPEELRAVATRYDKRAYVFHGTVTVAAIRLWLRPCSAGVLQTPEGSV